MKNIVFIILLLTNGVFGQNAFKENSIGLAQVVGYEGIHNSHMSIGVVIPLDYLNVDASVKPETNFLVEANLKIYSAFDSHALLDTTGTFLFEMALWCENDNGIAYRPETTLKVRVSDFLEKYEVDNEMQYLLGFVMINATMCMNLEKQDIKETIRVMLDKDQDNIPEAYVWTIPDEAQNCDGKPENSLVIYLRTPEGNYRMRCCGP